jgi:hypothetical protein
MRSWGIGLAVAAAWIGLAGWGAGSAKAQVWSPESGRLLATGGVTALDGSGGGGLATWALITGYGTRDAVGGNVHSNFVGLPNFNAYTTGAAIGLYDRVELSYNHLWFDTGRTGARLGLGNGFLFQQDAVGVKVRVLGDAVYSQDSWLPQISIGALYRVNDQSRIIHAVGARSRDGVDAYLSASKLFLDQSVLLNATVRFTRANQFGVLGFGGDRNDSYTAEFEGSAAYLVSRRFAVGAEYRTRPSNLRFSQENNAASAFAAYFPTKNLSLTLAYVSLGTVATVRNQHGIYLSAQLGF